MDIPPLSALFPQASMDWVVLAAFALIVALDAMRSGLSRATALALAFPLTLVLLSAAADARLMGDIAAQLATPGLRILLSAGFLILLFILMYRMADTFGADSYHPLQALLAGLAVAAIAIVVWLQIPALDTVWHFGPQTQALFGAAYRFWWLLAAYIALAFARG